MQVARQGFTITELMTTVAIMGIVAVAAAPSVMSRIPHHRLSQANWQVFIGLNQAKARAVAENREVVVTVDTGNEEYTFWVDEDRDDVRDADELTTHSVADIPGIQLTGYPLEFAFQPDGTMECSYYFAYVRVTEPDAGDKIVYTFANGSIDGYHAQEM